MCDTIAQWCVYAHTLAAFHALEFLWAARFHPATLTAESFLLNHSREYKLATVLAWVEFWLEAWLLSSHDGSHTHVLKGLGSIAKIGTGMAWAALALRVVAMWTAGSHFTHLIALQRAPGHTLVRTGVYAIARHPAYAGWFWWSVASQIMLTNPISLIVYAWASYKFFADRIPFEEERLVEQYGQEYILYARSTWIGIPFVQSAPAIMYHGKAGLHRASSVQ